MDGVFNGCSTDNIETFFSNMIVCDVSMPHTKERISPITFSEFLIRNNIFCINQYQVYDAVNKFWKRYQGLTPNILEQCQRKYDMSICEQEHAGWNKLIDYLNRVLDVQKFEGHPYYQMHYLSHVCYLFSHDSAIKCDENSVNKSSNKSACYLTIWDEILKPILYQSSIRTVNQIWAPIMCYSDVRFSEGITLLCARVSSFIESHSGRGVDYKNLDIKRLSSLREIVLDGMKGINDNKYNDDTWKVPLSLILSRSDVLETDLNLCEMKDSFDRDGMKCCNVFKKIDRVKRHYNNNEYDPDEAIDDLLDVLSSTNKGLESYNISIDKKEVKSDKSK